jgi:hypothetical protein
VLGRTSLLTRSFISVLAFPDDPKGYIDTPAEGAMVPRGQVTVAGGVRIN